MNNLIITKLDNNFNIPDFDLLWSLRQKYGVNKIFRKEGFYDAHRYHASFGITPCKYDKDSNYMFGLNLNGSKTEIPNELKSIHQYVCKKFNCEYNQVIINWFEDGNDYIPNHKDYIHNLNLTSGVISVSLMDNNNQNYDTKKRKLIIKTLKTKEETHHIDLEHKTIVCLKNDFLTEYSHGVPPTKLISESGKRLSVPRRISLSFRKYD